MIYLLKNDNLVSANVFTFLYFQSSRCTKPMICNIGFPTISMDADDDALDKTRTTFSTLMSYVPSTWVARHLAQLLHGYVQLTGWPWFFV